MESFSGDPSPIGEEVAALCGFEFVPAPSRQLLKVRFSKATGVQLKHVDHSWLDTAKAFAFHVLAGPIALVAFVSIGGFLFLLTRFL